MTLGFATKGALKTIEFSTLEDLQVNWQDGVSKTNVLDMLQDGDFQVIYQDAEFFSVRLSLHARYPCFGRMNGRMRISAET